MTRASRSALIVAKKTIRKRFADGGDALSDENDTNASFQEMMSAPVDKPQTWLDRAAQSVRDYTAPTWTDYQRGASGPASMVQSGIENMKSGNPLKMLAGAGQDVLGTIMTPFAPVGGAIDAAKGSAERTFGPAAGQAVDVASQFNPEGIFGAAARLGHYSPDLEMIMGPMAKGADLNALALDKKMAREGSSPEEISSATQFTTSTGRVIPPNQLVPAEAIYGKSERPVIGAAQAPENAGSQERFTNPVGMHSAAAEAAAALPHAKGTPQQFKSVLQKAGVKPSEFENSNFDEAFANQPSVTRDQIVQHFQNALPQVSAKVLNADVYGAVRNLAGKASLDEDTFDQIMENAGEDKRFNNFREPSERKDFLLDEYPHALGDYLGVQFPEKNQTKFNDYQLPGGENYREVLLKAPSNAPPPKKFYDVSGEYPQTFSSREQAQKHVDYLNNIALTDQDTRFSLVRHPPRIAEREIPLEESPNDFHSSHWNDPNVLAHLRMNDRFDEDGNKALHIEELQSDWGQAGRKKGFAGESNDGETGNGVPKAPYVTNTKDWTDLALKRALQEAAKGGYDKLTWTPGEQQAARYDLSKHVKSLKLTHNRDGAGNLEYVTENGTRHLEDIKSQQHLADTVGKDIAAKLYDQAADNNGVAELHGQDLAIGGQGMKSYYDQIVPSRLKELVKKLDPNVKIERDAIQIPSDDDQKDFISGKMVAAPGIRITPQMREKILKGLPAFNAGGAIIDKALRLTSRARK